MLTCMSMSMLLDCSDCKSSLGCCFTVQFLECDGSSYCFILERNIVQFYDPFQSCLK
jgi:hypothetical protein